MATNEFWCTLHQFAAVYRSEGATTGERQESALAYLQRMPGIARRELLADLALVMSNMPKLYLDALDATRKLEEAEQLAHLRSDRPCA